MNGCKTTTYLPFSEFLTNNFDEYKNKSDRMEIITSVIWIKNFYIINENI